MKCEKNQSTLTLSALLILLYIGVTLILSSLMLLSGLEISAVGAVVSALAAVAVFVYAAGSQNRQLILHSVCLAAAVITVSLFLCGNIYDLSYDGNWYHKASLGSLAYGWNPVYSSLADFAATPGGVMIGNLAESAIWADHYCKAPWIVGANIYSLTGNIECAKAINPMLAYCAFAFVYSYLSPIAGKFFGGIIAALAAANPVSLAQMFTFYTDGLLACSLYIIIALLAQGVYDKYEGNDKLRTIALFCAIVLCVNIKFTGLAYAAVFCFAFFVFTVADSIKRKNTRSVLGRSVGFYAASVSVAVLVVGSSSYVKNTVEHANPLHPLFGAEKVDIMLKNQPDFFDNLNPVSKLFYSTFSRTDNLIGEGSVTLKPFFDITDYEIAMASSAPDLRIGGFGPFFGGILVISLLILVFAFVYLLFKNRRALCVGLAVILPTVALLCFMQESWWARYSPHFYILPLLALLFLAYVFGRNKDKKRCFAAVGSLFLASLMAVNCSFFALYIGKCAVKSDGIKDSLTYASVLSRETPLDIAFSSYAYYGIEYNFKDFGINYRTVASLPNGGFSVYGDKATAAPAARTDTESEEIS